MKPSVRDLDLQRLASAANSAFADGDIPAAIELYRRALAISPKNRGIHINLGLLYYRSGALAEAESMFRLHPGNPLALYGLGAVRAAMGELQEAENMLRRSLQLAPDNAHAYEELARVLSAQRRHEEAEELLRKFPNESALLNALGMVLMERGRLDDAIEAYTRSAQLVPLQSQAYAGLAQGKRFTPADEPIVQAMRAALDSGRLPPDERGQLLFALGKVLDDLALYEAAMDCYREANEIADQPFQPSRQQSRQAMEQQSEAIRKLSLQSLEAREATEGPRPIFIVGMMRSGTTLVEQILSRHPDVAAGGELPFWIERLPSLLDLAAPAWHERKVVKAAKQYASLIRDIAGEKPNVTDKLPENFRLLGLLSSIFPNAVFIHCRRHPVDTCLSIFFASLQRPPEWSRDLESLVHAYRLYERTMDDWRDILPASSLFEISYEDLVKDREVQTRGLLEFLGLPWDAKCLSPERSERAVATSSLWQVRQPVYTTSIGRWRHYEPWLGPLTELLYQTNSPSQPQGN